jgi:ATP-dependent RNA helicase DDX55/SPB4
VLFRSGRLEALSSRVPDLLKNLEILILDEADRLLDLGFSETLQKILLMAPKQKRVGLFSATLKYTLEEEYSFLCLRNPLKISLGPNVPKHLENRYIIIKAEEKLALLIWFLQNQFRGKKVMVFFATCAMVDYFTLLLEKLNISVNLLGLHGKMVPKKRQALFKKFCNLDSAVLFCTDLAARGLDFPDVDAVIQFDAPKDPRFFAHRCGRTARAGKTGSAILFLLENEDGFRYLIRNRNIQIEEQEPPTLSSWNDQFSPLLKDRELFEKSKLAFVSFIRHYKEHLANYVFSLAKLDLEGMVKCFGLIQVPKMPELKGLCADLGRKDLVFDSIPFADPVREHARIEKLANQKPKVKLHIPKNSIKNTVSWSKGKAKKEGKSVFKASKILNRIKEKPSKEEGQYDELDDDYREYKKSKKTNK